MPNFASTVTFDGGQLNVGGATCTVAAGDNDLCVAGDAEIDGELEVDGTTDIDGTALDIDITTGSWSIDGDAAANLSTNTGDMTIENEDKSIIIKADEGVGDALYLDVNETTAGSTST